MRKWICISVVAILLSGCAGQETFETVSDEMIAPVSAEARQLTVELPQEAATPTVESENGSLYICDGYEIGIQTLIAGDLDATVRSISGYSAEELTLIRTTVGDMDRYDFVWACAGEGGDRIGRAAVLDDGDYHYVLTVICNAEDAPTHEAAWQRMFQSFRAA